MEAQWSQLVQVLKAQKARIVDSSQEVVELKEETDILMEEFRVQYQQPNQLEFDDVNIEEVVL